jgi:hypothetical protein
MNRLVLAFLAFAAVTVAPAAPALAKPPADVQTLSIGYLRNDGLAAPFAYWNGKWNWWDYNYPRPIRVASWWVYPLDEATAAPFAVNTGNSVQVISESENGAPDTWAQLTDFKHVFVRGSAYPGRHGFVADVKVAATPFGAWELAAQTQREVLARFEALQAESEAFARDNTYPAEARARLPARWRGRKAGNLTYVEVVREYPPCLGVGYYAAFYADGKRVYEEFEYADCDGQSLAALQPRVRFEWAGATYVAVERSQHEGGPADSIFVLENGKLSDVFNPD